MTYIIDWLRQLFQLLPLVVENLKVGTTKNGPRTGSLKSAIRNRVLGSRDRIKIARCHKEFRERPYLENPFLFLSGSGSRIFGVQVAVRGMRKKR